MTGEKQHGEENKEKVETIKRGRKKQPKQVKVGISESGIGLLNEYVKSVNQTDLPPILREV